MFAFRYEFRSGSKEVCRSSRPVTVTEVSPLGLLAAVSQSHAQATAESEKHLRQEEERIKPYMAEDESLAAGPIDDLIKLQYGSKWVLSLPAQYYYHYPLTYARKAEAEAEVSRRNDLLKAEKEKQDAEKAAAAAAAAQELREWAAEHGSELTKLRMEEGYDSWQQSAMEDRSRLAAEHADAVVAQVAAATGLKNANDADFGDLTYEFDEEPRKNPTLDELKNLKAVREAVGDLATAELVYVTYEFDKSEYDGDEDDQDENEPVKRCEIKLTIPHQFGERERYLLAS
jgi:hypothetical protein